MIITARKFFTHGRDIKNMYELRASSRIYQEVKTSCRQNVWENDNKPSLVRTEMQKLIENTKTSRRISLF
jgi:hypothetical protein